MRTHVGLRFSHIVFSLRIELLSVLQSEWNSNVLTRGFIPFLFGHAVTLPFIALDCT